MLCLTTIYRTTFNSFEADLNNIKFIKFCFINLLKNIIHGKNIYTLIDQIKKGLLFPMML